MKIKTVDFMLSAVKKEQYPQENMPEIAFVGRSNVGKSSIMNSLMQRKKMVKVSSKPGKTRLINFFKVNDEIILVDLPGYGYAAVSKTEKAKWGGMIEEYLAQRDALKRVVLLVDIRHKPTVDDKLMFNFIKYHNGSVFVIATKADKLSKMAATKNLEVIREELKVDAVDTLISYSSETHEKREELWAMLLEE